MDVETTLENSSDTCIDYTNGVCFSPIRDMPIILLEQPITDIGNLSTFVI